ncbi:META domain-containing protein [Aggregatilinea lenta]|uniref:META domain-containing protein n=1 Tax=Aggregatilinea lenta TaxID=913108 RepID=UPI000E5AD1CF|nr:META domain-containing protein [Aggregatilinea lenta]
MKSIDLGLTIKLSTHWMAVLALGLLIASTLVPVRIAAAQDADELAGTQWQLVSFDEDLVANTTISLNFNEDGQAAGSAGCNMYNAAYSADGTALNFEQAISTLMACTDEGVMEQEQAYLSALETASSYELAEGQLTITYDEDQEMVFEPADTLAGTSWTLTSLDGDAPAGTITLTFDDERRVVGSGGCNNYSTTYELASNSVSFSPPVSTRMACADDAVNEQELAYFGALEAATGYEVSDDQLVIPYGDGAELVFTRRATLADTSWQLETLDGETLADGSEITLMFEEEDRVSGSGGCNVYGGSYSLDRDALTFSQVISTERACLDDAIMAQEQAYFAALASATSYTLTDEQLTIAYGDDQQMVFVRASDMPVSSSN